MTLRRGAFVDVTFAGRTLRAMVTLASGNGRSLIVMFDGMLGGYVGAMPLLQHDDGTWRDAMTSEPAVVKEVLRQ